MRASFILGLALAILALVLAFQNTAPASVNLLFWTVEGPRYVALLVAFGLGIATVGLLLGPPLWRRSRRLRQRNKQVHELERTLEQKDQTLAQKNKRIQYLEGNWSSGSSPTEGP